MSPEKSGRRRYSSKELGSAGERMAAEFLRRKGYRILERNYRTPYGEIDLIARDKQEIIFIEVRTRRQEKFGTPTESLTRDKISHWERAASFYLQKENGFDRPFRFEFVGIDLSGETPRISLVKNAL
jgi:putative endonuclease